MPTAAVTKPEKQAPAAESSIKQGIVIVEHKIRNLEKRKARLESYLSVKKSGKELAKDQEAALSKYEEVVQILEFARDLAKQFNTVATDHAKNKKKQARKEAQEKSQHELSLIKETLIVQEVLSSLGQEDIREDFLQGKKGITLTPEELQQFDDLYVDLTYKRDDTVPFLEQFQTPAENMLLLVEGKSKQAFGTTYQALKEKINDITKCGYFDKNVQVVEAVEPEVPVAEPVVEPVIPPPDVAETIVKEDEEVEIQPEEVVVTPPVISHTFQPKEELEPLVEAAPVMTHTFQPTVHEEVRGGPPIDPAFYTPSHLSVFKSGTIDFMQDNELDTPEVDSIPTLTYTNQSYNPVDTAAQPQPEPLVIQPTQHIENVNNYQDTTEDKEWKISGGGGGGGGDAPSTGNEWSDSVQAEESWAQQIQQQWQQQPVHNDGFIPAGGRGGGRGRGRGGDKGKGTGGNNRGGRGGSGAGGPNQSNRGGHRGDNGYYQNGYRDRGEKTGGRGGGPGGAPRGQTNSERPSGGRGGGRGRGGSGYRGGGGYRQ